jgi:hypothetical protein
MGTTSKVGRRSRRRKGDRKEPKLQQRKTKAWK